MSERHSAPAGQRSGILVSTPLDGGPEVIQDTITCGHCDYTWVFLPGSGRRRGFCMRCGRITCGRPACQHLGCSCAEHRLDNLEAGRPLDHRPIMVQVPGPVPE